MKRPPLVEAEWIDACDISFTGSIAQAIAKAKLTRRFQAGYLIYQGTNSRGEEISVLAQTYDPPGEDDTEEEVDKLTVIPTAWVKKIYYKPSIRRVNRGAKVKPEGVVGVSTDTPPPS